MERLPSSRSSLLPLLSACILIVGMFLGYKAARYNGLPAATGKGSSSLDALIHLIKEKYVDSLNDASLYRSGVDGILKNLDPHTVYIPSDQTDRMNEELDGNFFGIGIEFYPYNDTLIISYVLPDGPSGHSALLPGDRIIQVDGVLVAGQHMKEEGVIKKIRGNRESHVVLDVMHEDGSKATLTLNRGQVPIHSVSVSSMLDAETGYIKLDLFNEQTADEFKHALQVLKQRGMKKLLIDLRENPGGYLDAAAQVADQLIAGKNTLVVTRGRNRADSLESRTDGLFEQGGLAVLIDENSASASEILAGIIQDLDRGILVGRRSFGKGLVQEQFELPDHAAIRITTARYYLPSGRCIQRSYADGKDKYRQDILDRFQLHQSKEAHVDADSTPAYYTRSRRRVYAHEGITPDEAVPLDTVYHAELDTFYSSHGAEQISRRLLRQFPALKKQISSPEVFLSGNWWTASLDAALREALQIYPEATSWNRNPVLYHDIRQETGRQLARLLYGNNGRFAAGANEDLFVQKALTVLKH